MYKIVHSPVRVYLNRPYTTIMQLNQEHTIFDLGIPKWGLETLTLSVPWSPYGTIHCCDVNIWRVKGFIQPLISWVKFSSERFTMRKCVFWLVDVGWIGCEGRAAHSALPTSINLCITRTAGTQGMNHIFSSEDY